MEINRSAFALTTGKWWDDANHWQIIDIQDVLLNLYGPGQEGRKEAKPEKKLEQQEQQKQYLICNFNENIGKSAYIRWDLHPCSEISAKKENPRKVVVLLVQGQELLSSLVSCLLALYLPGDFSLLSENWKSCKFYFHKLINFIEIYRENKIKAKAQGRKTKTKLEEKRNKS